MLKTTTLKLIKIIFLFFLFVMIGLCNDKARFLCIDIIYNKFILINMIIFYMIYFFIDTNYYIDIISIKINK